MPQEAGGCPEVSSLSVPSVPLFEGRVTQEPTWLWNQTVEEWLDM